MIKNILIAIILILASNSMADITISRTGPDSKTCWCDGANSNTTCDTREECLRNDSCPHAVTVECKSLLR